VTVTAVRTRVVGSLLPATAGGRRLLVAFLVDTFGSGLFFAGSTVFFIRHVGLTPAQVATGMSLAALVGFVAMVPTGLLADRFGIRRVQCALHLWRATGFVLYVFCHDFATFLPVVAMIGVGDRGSPPLNQALVSLAVPIESRVRTMGLLRSAKNLAFTFGGLLAVAALSIGTPSAYLSLVLGNAASFVVVAWIVVRLPLLRDDHRVAAVTRFRVTSLRDRRYVTLAGLNGVLALHNSLLFAGIPLFVLKRTHAPVAVVGALFVVNTTFVTLAQVRLSRPAETMRGAARTQLRAGLALALTCVVVAMAPEVGVSLAVAVLVAGILLLSLGEMLQSAGGWAISFDLAPHDRQGEYLSVFNLGTAMEGIVGPALVTVLVVHATIVGWLALAALFVAAGVASFVVVNSTVLARFATYQLPPEPG
jgi:MFS family permease